MSSFPAFGSFIPLRAYESQMEAVGYSTFTLLILGKLGAKRRGRPVGRPYVDYKISHS